MNTCAEETTVFQWYEAWYDLSQYKHAVRMQTVGRKTRQKNPYASNYVDARLATTPTVVWSIYYVAE